MSVDERLARDVARARAFDVDAALAELDAPRSRFDGLRSLATPVRRVALVGYLGLVGVLAVAWQGPRAVEWSLVGWVAALAVAGAAAMSAALRPLHRPAGSAPWAPVVAIAALAVGVAVSGVLPGLAVDPGWPVHLHCWRATTVAAVLATVGGALLERDGGAAPWRSATLAFGAGAAAFAFQTLVCPVVDPAHVGLAHASCGAWVAVGWAGVRAVRGGHFRAP